MRDHNAVGHAVGGLSSLDRADALPKRPQSVRPEMASRHAGPVLDPDRPDLPEAGRHLHQLRAAVRRHIPAGRRVALHGDLPAGEEKANHGDRT